MKTAKQGIRGKEAGRTNAKSQERQELSLLFRVVTVKWCRGSCEKKVLVCGCERDAGTEDRLNRFKGVFFPVPGWCMGEMYTEGHGCFVTYLLFVHNGTPITLILFLCVYQPGWA